MKSKRIFVLFMLAALTGSRHAVADEGMWMINAIDSALEKKMQERGLKLSANEIYNADADGAAISDAVVSLDFGCTGSIISDRGLLITNHHCAYSDVHRLSTPEHNYLEDGFWAMRDCEEVCIKGKGAYLLKRIIDVTEEVESLKAELDSTGVKFGMRKLSHVMETRYKKATGLEAALSSMWKGASYYMSLYEVYRDVRLVAAPPVTSAAFGGDTDNWEWPQHKCDFALYRIYTAPDGSPAEYAEENVPMTPKSRLSISLDGYGEGDFTMIIGYPGRTDRYCSSYKVRSDMDVKLPISGRIRGEQMKIIDAWMDRDPLIRLKYSDYYFNLCNVQELNEGQEECFRRFRVAEARAEEEKSLLEWISEDPVRTACYGRLLHDLKSGYAAEAEPERQASYFRETLVRGSRLFSCIRRAWNTNTRNRDYGIPQIIYDIGKLDMRVEHDLVSYAISEYIGNVGQIYLGEWQKEVISKFTSEGRCDTKALAEWLWDESIFRSADNLAALESQDFHSSLKSDPLCRFLVEVGINEFRNPSDRSINITELNREYTQAIYQMRMSKGKAQYPDANSTMRITYGTVGGIEPYDAVMCSWQSTTKGLLEKHNPESYDFCLKERQKGLLEAGAWGRWGMCIGQEIDAKSDKACCRTGKGMKQCRQISCMPVDFLTDNDITGGNSGSPVLNARGELIGLAFDGNKESLAGDSMFVDGYNKCVCVDIRYILWTIDEYAGMDRIIEELGL